MANPRIENGSFSIANELADAIIRFEFSKRQYKILLYLMRHLYGRKKVTEKMFSLRTISSSTGIDPADVSRTVKDLTRKNIIKRQDRLLLIQHNYELWGKEADNGTTAEKESKYTVGLVKNEDGSYSPPYKAKVLGNEHWKIPPELLENGQE